MPAFLCAVIKLGERLLVHRPHSAREVPRKNVTKQTCRLFVTKKMLDEGKLGESSGEGFFKY